MAPILSRLTSGGGFGFGKKKQDSSFSSSGGTIVNVGVDRYHVFTSTGSGTLITSSPATVEIMVVGSGGDCSATPMPVTGGGGGGGIMYADNATLISGTHNLSVGAPTGGNTTRAGDSSFTSASGWVLTGLGGGRSATAGAGPGGAGGSGGGGGYDNAGSGGPGIQPAQTSNIPTPYVNYGNSGANPTHPGSGYGGSSGGGGAGGAGTPGLTQNVSPGHGSGGNGGAGQPFPSFGTTNIGPALPAPTQPHITSNGLYGGGGGGGANSNDGATSPNNTCVGGSGGGGDGNRVASGIGSPGLSYGGGAGAIEIEAPGAVRTTGFQGIICVKLKNVN